METKQYLFEEWRDIKGYEGLYQVSNMGRVKSLERIIFINGQYPRTIKERFLNLCVNSIGYVIVILYKKRRKEYSVHRLVAETFIPNPNNLPLVNHKNEVKTDNRVENLEYCSDKYNSNYGTRAERLSKANTNHPKLSIPILQFDLQGILIAEYPSASEAERQTGADKRNIINCCKGRCKTSGGYMWVYK